MRAEIQMKTGHLFWAKDRLASGVIDLQEIFNDYWSTSKHVFTVPSQSGSQTVLSYLMAEHSGHHFRWKAPTASLVSRITILCDHYCSSLCNCPSRLANNLQIDGLSALFAPYTRGIVKGILPTDERTDREGCGERY